MGNDCGVRELDKVGSILYLKGRAAIISQGEKDGTNVSRITKKERK